MITIPKSYIEIGRVTVEGHIGVLWTKNGHMCPSGFKVVCETCDKTLRHASGCHRVYAPSYLEPDMEVHVKKASSLTKALKRRKYISATGSFNGWEHSRYDSHPHQADAVARSEICLL